MSKFVDFYLIGELVDSHGNVHYEDLKNLPTVDAVERKRGEWIDYEDVENSIYGHVTCLCSICGHVSQYKENYCMHCGADMRGEENDKG